MKLTSSSPRKFAPRKQKINFVTFLLSIIIVIGINGFFSSVFAILPPVRSVQITSQTSGSNVKYTFSVYDAQRNLTISGDTGFYASNRITTPTATDGIVIWKVDTSTGTGPSFYKTYHSVYDPKIGSWITGTQPTSIRIISDGLETKEGIVRWSVVEFFTQNLKHYFSIYDPNSSSWKERVDSYAYNSANNFSTPVIGDGIVLWTNFYKPSPASSYGDMNYYTLVYDISRGNWIYSSKTIANVLSFNVGTYYLQNGTIYYSISGVNYLRGYNSDSGNWYDGVTIPLAYFVPSQVTGNVPLKVYFWDMSIGGSSWNLSFGDGNSSNEKSPFYTYNSAAGTPYTAIQTVTGPGGTRTKSIVITSTTPYSITGNIANSNGFKVSGVTVTLSGTLSRTTQTDSNGNYSFANLTVNGNYTVTVTKNSYTFTPSSISFTNLTGSQTANFIGKLNSKPSDFDGDNKTDVSVFRPSNGYWFTQNSSNNSVISTAFGLGTDTIVPNDFDGDGKTDIAVWRASDGAWYILYSSNSTFNGVSFGSNGDIPVANDYDGDDKADVAFFRPSTGYWYILKSSDSQYYGFQFGFGTDIPVSGDFDGDNKSDVAVFRPSNVTWYVLKSSDSNTLSEQFGQSGDKLVPGDYDGDGKTDFATFRPGDSNWRIKKSTDGTIVTTVWGFNTDILTPGDYDGDGKYDIGVFRPSDGNWYALKSSDQSLFTIGFGTNGDYPTPNSYLPQ